MQFMGAGFSVSHSLCSKLVGASLSIGYSFNDALRKKLIEQFETSEATNPPGECCLFPIRWFNMLLMMKFLAQFRQLMLWFFLKKAALNCWVENQNVCRSFYSTCSVRKKQKQKQSRGCLSSRGRNTLPDFDLSPQLLLRTERYNKRLPIYSLFV